MSFKKISKNYKNNKRKIISRYLTGILSTLCIVMSFYGTSSTVKAEELEPENIDISSNNYSIDEINLMANVVWQEARGESRMGQVAVAEVIMNRVHSPFFPNTITEVISQNNQFSSYDIAVKHGIADDYYLTLCINVINKYESVFNDDNILFFKRNDGSFFFNKALRYSTIGNHSFYKKQI